MSAIDPASAAALRVDLDGWPAAAEALEARASAVAAGPSPVELVVDDPTRLESVVLPLLAGRSAALA